MPNYLIYPTKVMNITQNYAQSYSHKPHTTGNIKDYPIDEACEDSGRSYFYCPCDEIKIVKIYGVGNGGTNTLWLQSTSKVIFADGTSNYVTIMVTHPNDDTLKGLKVGQTFKRKAAMFLEGTDGQATGNHFHIAVGKGTMTEGGWQQNSNGKWVLRTSAGACKPEAAMYVDSSFTTIKSSNGISFKKLSETSSTKKTSSKYTTGTYEVTASLLNVRKGAGTSYEIKKYTELTANAQAQVYKLSGKKPNGLVKGCQCNVTEVKGSWGQIPSGWICLDYCKKL